MSDVWGSDGDATLPTGFNLDVNAWSATIQQNSTNYSTFAGPWMHSKPTTAQVTGSISGVVQHNAANTQPVPSASGDIDIGSSGSFQGSVTLTAETGCTISGTFTFTSIQMSRDDNSEMNLTANIESDGPVSITWDETA